MQHYGIRTTTRTKKELFKNVNKAIAHPQKNAVNNAEYQPEIAVRSRQRNAMKKSVAVLRHRFQIGKAETKNKENPIARSQSDRYSEGVSDVACGAVHEDFLSSNPSAGLCAKHTPQESYRQVITFNIKHICARIKISETRIIIFIYINSIQKFIELNEFVD